MSEQTREPIFGNSLNSVAKAVEPEPPPKDREFPNGTCDVHGDKHAYFKLPGPHSPACVNWKPLDPAPVPKEHSGPYKMESRNDYQVCLKCGTRWFANEVLPCPKCAGAAPVDQQEGQRAEFEKWGNAEGANVGCSWNVDHYENRLVESAFQGWCAGRAALTSSPQPGSSNYVCDDPVFPHRVTFADGRVVAIAKSEKGPHLTISPKSDYPKPCGVCDGVIQSNADLDWHGYGNCRDIPEPIMKQMEAGAISECSQPRRSMNEIAEEALNKNGYYEGGTVISHCIRAGKAIRDALELYASECSQAQGEKK